MKALKRKLRQRRHHWFFHNEKEETENRQHVSKAILRRRNK